ncbi:hypothetical protein [Fusobacterium phage Fnu1]|uniref:Uncharacterized protein n=1 Tax=Fusobacterium phage Fnu1 TaxID=2530024 RepID=A0A481W614_9CAUD|nr:hypothetical protein KMD24_gp076 [Fusobacterium phage Fnu1]QBJ04146.1 hypothetical protein [Fusobacterium phage Fnu1]
MKERIKVNFYLPKEDEYLYKWELNILDRGYDFNMLGYDIFNIGKNDFIIVQFNEEDKYNTKIYSTTQKVTSYAMEEIKEIVDCINKAYFYIDISDKVSIVLDYDRDLDKDRTRKRLNNYFDTYWEAQEKYNKIIDIIKGEVENNEK